MKALVIGLSFVFLTTSAEAAKLSTVKRLQNRDLDTFVKAFIHFGEDTSVFGEESYAVAHKITIKEREASEPWDNTMKQIVYWSRAHDGATVPQEEVSLRRILKKEREMEKAIKQHAFRGANGRDVDSAAHDLQATLGSAISGFRHLKLFVGTDSGDFADCAFVAVLDEENAEVALISSCKAD